MKNPAHQVSKFFHNFLKNNKEHKILLACSGGVDSMVLAEILRLQNRNFALAHCNFQLRGKDSGADENFVKNWAAEHSVSFFSKKFDTQNFAEENGISIQMAARELRYSFFDEILKKGNFDYLVTAHHSDDVLETIFLNLGRGTGLKGTAGILPKTDKILRPLWLCSKEEILDFAETNQVQFHEDATNSKDDYQRNFLRHNVLESFKNTFPNFSSSFYQSQKWLADDRVFFENLIKEKLDSLIEKIEDSEILSLTKIENSESGRAVLRHWLQPQGNFDWRSLFKILDENPSEGKSFKSEKHEVIFDRGNFILRKKEKSQSAVYFIDKEEVAIQNPIPISFEKIPKKDFILKNEKGSAALDFDKLKFPLKLRKWEIGDRFSPLGMSGSKKLSDYFTDLKYNKFQKENTWLLESDGEIVWLNDGRISEHFKIVDSTESVYFVRLF